MLHQISVHIEYIIIFTLRRSHDVFIVMWKFVMNSLMYVFIHSIHTRIREPGAHSTVTKWNWMPFHLKMRRSPQIWGVGGGWLWWWGDRGGGHSQTARQLRHNSARTYNQTIAIIINRYTFNDRVCRTQRPNVSWTSAGARDYRVYAIAVFVWYSFGARWWMYRFGVRICGKTSPRSAGVAGAGTTFLRSELAEPMICGAVSVHLADRRTGGTQGITHRNKDRSACHAIWKLCVIPRVTRRVCILRRGLTRAPPEQESTDAGILELKFRKQAQRRIKLEIRRIFGSVRFGLPGIFDSSLRIFVF